MSDAERELNEIKNTLRWRGYKTREPQRIADVISGLLARRGYARVQSAAASEAAWREAAGHLAAKTRPGNVKRGVLEVIVLNSTVLQELTFQKKRIVQRLAELLPDEKIRDVRFRVGMIE
jgi:predicted nucleic acid-binding Zn ribbon protein